MPKDGGQSLTNERIQILGSVGLPVVPFSTQETFSIDEAARLADAYAETSKAYRDAAALALGTRNRIENYGYDSPLAHIRRTPQGGRLEVEVRGFRDE